MRSQTLREQAALYSDRNFNFNVPNITNCSAPIPITQQVERSLCNSNILPVLDNSFQTLERNLVANDHDRFINI